MAREKKKLSSKEKDELETLSPFLTSEQMADYFGIARSTFYNILERDSELNGRYKRGKSKAIAISAGKLMKKVQDGNMTAIIFHLKTKGGWKEAGNEPVNTSSSDELLQKLIDGLPN